MQTKTKPLITVGHKLRKIREIKDITQEYLASKLNLSQRAYSKIELGKTQLSLDRVEEICAVLEVDMDTLLNFDEKQIFNSCSQSGTINHIYNQHGEQVKELYEKLLLSKDAEIKSLKELLKQQNT